MKNIDSFLLHEQIPAREEQQGVVVCLEPGGEVLFFPRLNTVLQLLNKLGISSTDALIIRGEELLTPDRKIRRGEKLRVRFVLSQG